jgi:type VI protein secretion system component VasF
MSSVHLKMPRWQLRLLTLSGAVLLLSGLAWLLMHYSVGAGTGGLPHPAEAWWMRLHGFGVFLGLFALGVVANGHVVHGLRATRRHRRRRQRVSGLMLVAALLLLVATGYALYYFVPEEVRNVWSWTHTALGVAIAAGSFWHARGVTA